MRLFYQSLFGGTSLASPLSLSQFPTIDKAGACWFSRTNNVSADGYTTIGTTADFGTGYRSGVLVIDESDDSYQGIALEGGTDLQQDDHNAAAILKHSSGYYISAYTQHSSKKWFKYRRSTNVNDPTSWGAETEVSTTAYGSGTYCALFEVSNGDIHMLVRCQNSTQGWIDFKSTDNGVTFDSGRLIYYMFRGASYPVMYQDPNNKDRIHVAASEHPFSNTDGTSVNGIWYAYFDFSTDRWYDGEGSDYAIPIDIKDQGHVVYDETTAPVNEVWIEDIILSSEGYPRVLFTRHLNNPSPNWGLVKHRFYAEKTASGWQTPVDLGQINDKWMEIGTVVSRNNFSNPTLNVSSPEYFAQGRFDDNNPDRFFVGKQAGGTYDMSELFVYTRTDINAFDSVQITSGNQYHQRLFMPLKGSKYSLMWINARDYKDMKNFDQDIIIGILS